MESIAHAHGIGRNGHAIIGMISAIVNSVTIVRDSEAAEVARQDGALALVLQLMLAETVGGFSAPIAEVAAIADVLFEMLGFNVAAEVGLVAEVLDARRATPNAVNSNHVHGHFLSQGLTFP